MNAIMIKIFIFIIPGMLFSEQSNTIGSHLMKYFQSLIHNSCENKEMERFPFHYHNNSEDIAKFYMALPLHCVLTTEERELAESLPNWTWYIQWPYLPNEWLDCKDSCYVNYHKLLRSVSQRVIKSALKKIGSEIDVTLPVIHYRLGDVPFCRNRGHHLNRYSFFSWALDKALIGNVDKKILVVTSNRHESNSRTKHASNLYLHDFICFLREQGYQPIIQSRSILEDYITMVLAPVIISGGSSYSFMAGISSEGMFLCSQMGWESGRNFEGIHHCEWMYSQPPILHNDVKNYFDTDAVIKKLRDIE